MSRGGPPVKIIISAIFLVGGVYFVYMHSVTTARLRDAEKTAERYRREEETKVSQLQELMKSKDELQEKCDTDRQELVNRFNTCNNQNKMLKSQHDELENDYAQLQQERQKLQEDHAQQEMQRSHEFQQLKQEKELELATLKNQVADLTRQNEQLQNEISSLRTQLQNSQQTNVQLQLQQQQQQQQQVVQQQPAVGGAGLVAGGVANQGVGVANQGVANQGVGVANQGVGVANNAGGVINPADNANQQAPVVNMNANAGNGGLDLGAGQGQVGLQLAEQPQQVVQQPGGQEVGAGAGAVVPPGQDNAQHQVQAPEVNNNPAEQGEKAKGDEGQGHPVPDLQQHVQVQPPQLNEQVIEAKGANAGGVGSDLKDLNNGFHDNRIANEGPVNLQVQEPALPGQNVHHDVNDKGGDSPNNAIDNMGQQAKDALPLQPQGQGHQPLRFGRFGRQGPMDDMQGNQVDLGHEGHDGNMKVEVEEDEEEAHYNEEKNGKYQDGDEEDYA